MSQSVNVPARTPAIVRSCKARPIARRHCQSLSVNKPQRGRHLAISKLHVFGVEAPNIADLTVPEERSKVGSPIIVRADLAPVCRKQGFDIIAFRAG